MAYMNQERKKMLAPHIKRVLKKYGVKATLSTDTYSINVNIKSGKLNLIEEAVKAGNSAKIAEFKHFRLNQYYVEKFAVDDTVFQFYKDLIQAVKGEDPLFLLENGKPLWYDNSDPMTDYFNTAYYFHINVGKWSKPYEFTA